MEQINLGPIERVTGTRAVLGYLVGCAAGAAIAAPILSALFGVSV